MTRRALIAAALGVSVASGASAQEGPALGRIRQSYEVLNYDSVLAQGRRAIERERLSRSDRVRIYELMAFTYAALDSTVRAVESFRELARLDPDREPDVNRVSPRITALYASALGQVTVIRHVSADTVAFIAGQGNLPIRYQVSRPSRVVARVSGAGLEVVIDSGTVAGTGAVRWNALGADGLPAADGGYRITLEATSGRDVFEANLTVDVRRAAVDTLQHVTALEGYAERPESERPPRSWKPFGLAALYTAVAAGASLGLGSTQELGQEALTGLVTVSAASLVAGLVMSASRPEMRPVETNILYNRLLREQIARRNSEIAGLNAERRRQTMLRLTPVARVSP